MFAPELVPGTSTGPTLCAVLTGAVLSGVGLGVLPSIGVPQPEGAGELTDTNSRPASIHAVNETADDTEHL